MLNQRFILALSVLAIGLGAWYFVASRPQPVTPKEPRPFVWSVEMSDLTRIQVDLPRRDLSVAFKIGSDRYWYFTDPDGPQVDLKRWGGGITLLMSGPGANRLIAESPTGGELATFGLDRPNMIVHLQLKDGTLLEIHIGDATPDGVSYYTKQSHRTEVFTVDATWFAIIERLATEPPYPPAE